MTSLLLSIEFSINLVMMLSTVLFNFILKGITEGQCPQTNGIIYQWGYQIVAYADDLTIMSQCANCDKIIQSFG